MKYFKMSLGVVLLLCLQVAAFAQKFEPYIPEDQMPDVVQVLPAPPADPSTDFDHDILRYMWGKPQRKDPSRPLFYSSLFPTIGEYAVNL